MLNGQRTNERKLYDLRMEIRHVVENDLEALSVEVEKSSVYPPEMWETGKRSDMFRLSLPTQYGGMGLYLEQYFTVLEEIGRDNQAIRMFLRVVNGLDWEIMVEHDIEEMKNECPSKMGTDDSFVTPALIEPNCGPGAGIRSTAVKEEDKWVLDGRKTLIPSTDTRDTYCIIAASDEEKRKEGDHTAFYVPADIKGLRVESMPHMMGCRGIGYKDMIMRDMEIPNEYRLRAEGGGLTVFLHALTISRTFIGVCLLGLPQRMSELVIARAKGRITFGKALIQRQAVQQMLVDMATQVHVLRLPVRDCAQKADRGEGIEMISPMVKLHGIDAVRTMSDSCLEIFGGVGYFEDSPYEPVEHLYQDARAMWFKKGPRTIQHLTLVCKVIDADGEIRTSNYC